MEGGLKNRSAILFAKVIKISSIRKKNAQITQIFTFFFLLKEE